MIMFPHLHLDSIFWVSIDLEPIQAFIYLDLVRKGEEIEVQVRCS